MVILSEVQVARAVALLESGRSMRFVARDLNVAPSTIMRLNRRYQETGGYTRRQGQGRKRKTTREQDRFLRNCALRRRTSTARALQNDLVRATGVQVSDQTVRNRLKEQNLKPRRPVRKPRLTLQHRRARRTFAQEHVDWQLRHWTPILFTDESRFCLTRCDGRLRVWRRPGERYSQAAIQEVDRFGNGSVMVWGGISIDHRTELVVINGRLNARQYIDQVLDNHVLPMAAEIGDGFVLMQDNARPHTAEVTRTFLQNHRIQVMDWPAISPDLNPIEHVWDLLDRRVRARPNPPDTLQQLQEALNEEWRIIPQEDLRRLIRSMPRRCQAVIQAGGGHTRY